MAVPTDTTRIDVEVVRRRLADHRPVAAPEPRGWQAATALIVAPAEVGVDLAFIRRTVRRSDRWSGQMALPGGTRDAGDPDLAATAAREAREEVGVDLPAPVARLDDQRGRVTRGTIASYVYVLDHRPALRPAPTEVARAMWIGLPHLLDPASVTHLRWAGKWFPGVAYDGEVIWGLTHRIVGSFAAALGTHLPG